MLRILLGLGVVAAALLGSRYSEQVDLARFPIAWIGVLIALDGAARLRRGGQSPLAGFSDWMKYALASVVFWDVFELVDVRLHNWWYTGTSPNPWFRALFGAVSFATVLPAARLFVGVVSPHEEQMNVERRSPKLLALGLAMLGVALLFPRYAFPLAWLFLWPICEGGIHGEGLASPLRSKRIALRCLAVGLPIGLIWEGLNFGCARGWVYTVPFFEHPKLFEMPLAGYLGYLPFMLEAGAALALVDRIKFRAWMFPLVLVLHFGIDRACAKTSISTTPRLEQLRGMDEAVRLLATQGIHTPRELLEKQPQPSPDLLHRIAIVEEKTHLGVERAQRYVTQGMLAGEDPAIARLFFDKVSR